MILINEGLLANISFWQRFGHDHLEDDLGLEKAGPKQTVSFASVFHKRNFLLDFLVSHAIVQLLSTGEVREQ